jgi:hypothetical protein
MLYIRSRSSIGTAVDKRSRPPLEANLAENTDKHEEDVPSPPVGFGSPSLGERHRLSWSAYPGFLCNVPFELILQQDHVAEYGTHWNFFITLAVIPPLQMTLQPLFLYLPVPLVGLLVTTGG